MRAPSKRVERFIREAAERHEHGDEIAAWLDTEQAYNALRQHCRKCGHPLPEHDAGFDDWLCQVDECECDGYEPNQRR